MTERKKRLRLIQLGLLILGSLIIFFTYANKKQTESEKIITQDLQEKINKQMSSTNENNDVFYNIEYTGLDLAGNRYSLKSKEAYNNKNNQAVVNMKFVEAVFYFKDDTTLFVSSDEGVYNNRTLDMDFLGNVLAKYQGSELFADKAEYSNSKSFLTISNNVKIKDFRGTMVADKLFFDIKNQKLDITSSPSDKINANIDLK